MNKLLNLKGNWDERVPTFRNKLSRLVNSASGEQAAANINPFLNRNGGLVNPYIDYQKVLDNPNVTSKAKQFISQATGLMPSVNMKAAQIQAAEAVQPTPAEAVSPSGTTETQTKSVQSSNGIVGAAEKYIGTPYVWGGESMAEGGMDCSGFVYNALKDAGYNVGRTTAQGYRSYGSSVSKSDMQPGDLVFFGKNNNASHIGIYLGNGQMIHSSGGSRNTKTNPGKGVTINNVDYRNDFLEARRY